MLYQLTFQTNRGKKSWLGLVLLGQIGLINATEYSDLATSYKIVEIDTISSFIYVLSGNQDCCTESKRV